VPNLIARHRNGRRRWTAYTTSSRNKSRARSEGLSLADLTELTCMERSALSKLEPANAPIRTVETLMRYAEAVGKRLVLRLLSANEDESKASTSCGRSKMLPRLCELQPLAARRCRAPV